MFSYILQLQPIRRLPVFLSAVVDPPLSLLLQPVSLFVFRSSRFLACSDQTLLLIPPLLSALCSRVCNTHARTHIHTLTVHPHRPSARARALHLQLFWPCSAGSCGLGPASISGLKRGEKMGRARIYACVGWERRKVCALYVSVGHVCCVILRSCLCSVSSVVFPNWRVLLLSDIFIFITAELYFRGGKKIKSIGTWSSLLQ